MAVERQRGVSAFTIVWFGVMVSGGDGGIVPRMLVMTQQLSASSKIIQNTRSPSRLVTLQSY
jgi:hypothetical protein